MPHYVVLPGLDGLRGIREPFLDALAASGDVSFCAPPTSPLKVYADLSAHYLAILPAGRAVLVAESMSGPAAIAIAAQARGSISAVCLIGSFLTLPYPAFATRLLARLPLGAVPIGLMRFGSGWSAAFDPASRTIFRAIKEVDPGLLRSRLEALAEVDARAHFAAIQVPVLWLHGRKDRIITPRVARLQARSLEQAEFETIETGHFAMLERPLDLAGRVAAFAGALA
jgi:pimeloyl-[acyl-carrier protein] methyl ester esterase